MKIETSTFSGFKIYPGHGKLYIQKDSRVFRFAGSKEERLFLNRKNPRQIAWTVPYRRKMKKGITEETARKRSRKTVKAQRGIVGADLASIQARRTQKPEVRDAQRAAAISAAKQKKAEQEAKRKKNATGATGVKPSAPKVSRQQMKGSAVGGKAGR